MKAVTVHELLLCRCKKTHKMKFEGKKIEQVRKIYPSGNDYRRYKITIRKTERSFNALETGNTERDKN